MKKLINLSAAFIALSLMGTIGVKAMAVNSNTAKTDTVADPKKHPGPIDLDNHPEIMAKVQQDLKNGKINYRPAAENTDTILDLSKHPELVKALVNNPANWPIILKAYDNRDDTLSLLGKNKQVIRNIMTVLIRKNIIKRRSDITSFMLTGKAFLLNGEKLPENIHAPLAAEYIKTPDYIVYYGNSEMKGNGIFQRADNL